MIEKIKSPCPLEEARRPCRAKKNIGTNYE